MNTSSSLQSSRIIEYENAWDHQQTAQRGYLTITPVFAGYAIHPTMLGSSQQTAQNDVIPFMPVLAHHTAHPTSIGWSRPIKSVSRSRRTRLLTLHREATPPSRSATAVGDDQHGLSLHQWLSTLLSQRQTLELDITVLSSILHALWKKPACRKFMLNDVEYRKRAFNDFVMSVLKAYQSSEKMDENVPNGASDKHLRGQVEKSVQRSGARDSSPEPSDELPEPPMADPSDDERPPANTGTGGVVAAVQKQKTPRTPGGRRRKLRKSKIRKPKGRPSAVSDTKTSVALSGDICSRLPNLIRTAGRKKTDGRLACQQLAEKDEDDSAVPDSAFLFIRCVRCPEVVFTDYQAIREHWEARCHFLSCIMCDNIVSNSRLALAHLRLVHKEPVPDGWFRLVRCHPCRQSGFYSTEQVISHMANHRAERARNPALFPPFLTCYKYIRCNQCGVHLVNHRTELEDHYKRDPPPLCQHDPVRPPPIPCPICGRMWAGAAALAAHMKHRRGYCKGGATPRTAERAVCPVCHSRVVPGETMADHLMTHQAPGLRCVECGHLAASHQEMQAHWAFLWRCDCAACDTHVGRGARLLQHVVEDHDGGKLLTETARARPRRNDHDRGVCPICGKYQFKVKDHIALAHTTRYCPCCDKVVAMSTWRKHRRCQRNPDRTRCKVCQKVLSSGYAMRGHMRTHTGERPFECELCDTDFQQPYQLKAHMRSAHGFV